MQEKLGTGWPKTLWKIVTNPTVEVVAAIVVVLLATWVVVQAELDMKRFARTVTVPLVHK